MKLRLNPAWVRAGKTTSTSFPWPANARDLATRADQTIEEAAKALEEAYAELDRLTACKQQANVSPQ